MDEWFTSRQAASFLGVSVSTVYRMDAQGSIASTRTPGGQRRFNRSALEDYQRRSRFIEAPQNPSQYRNSSHDARLVVRDTQLDLPIVGASSVAPVAQRLRADIARRSRSVKHDDEPAPTFDVPAWLTEWEFRGSETKPYTHGFHMYPAMFIPQVARKLLLAFSRPADTVLDPFCGSGTTLAESRLLGRTSIGIERNPLAALIARVKTTPLAPERLIGSLETVVERVGRNAVIPVSFSKESNLDFWFPPEMVGRLNALREAIRALENEDAIRFFSVAYSEIVRFASYTKHGEFKLVRDKRKVTEGVHFDVISTFVERARKNIAGMADYYAAVSDSPVTILETDSTQDVGLPNESVDFVLTSPPYGDSRTTVAYGQFSRLSAQWLDLISDDAKAIDRRLLGGVADASFDDPVIASSDALRQAISLIGDVDETRAREVIAFYRDLARVFERIAFYLKEGGYCAVVIGNRTVKGVVLQTDAILGELCAAFGLTTHAILFRTIPNKRMPYENSPTNVVGQRAKTMHRESIVILRKR